MLIRTIPSDMVAPPAAMLAPGVALLLLDEGSRDVQASFAGAAVPPPYGSVEVLWRGIPRRVAALRPPIPGTSLSLPGGRAGLFATDLTADLTGDPVTLAAELDRDSQRRLLDFLLGFCRSAFRLGAEPRFAASCRRLAGVCAEPLGAATPIAEVAQGLVLVRGLRLPPGSTLYRLGRDEVATLPTARPGRGELQVIGAGGDDLLLVTGTQTLVWTLAPALALPHILALPEPELGRARACCRRALAALPADSPGGALLREMQAFAPATPRRFDAPEHPVGGALDMTIPDGAGGLFLRGWLRDPLLLVEGMILVTPGDSLPLPLEALWRVRRPDLAEAMSKAQHPDDAARPGFVAHVDAADAGPQPRLALRLRSGAEIELVPPTRVLPPAAARDAVLASVRPDDVTPPLMRACLAPPVARLHRAALRGNRVAELRRIGTPVPRPAASLVIPLYRNLGFLRFQLQAFAADPELRDAELIYVLDSPEQHAEAEHLLRGLHLLHGLAMTLVVAQRNLGFAGATNAGAEQARAPLLLLLNSDVVPLAPGWLGALEAARTRAGAVAAGPKLLFEDLSIQHAGLYFERDGDGVWFNRHYHKGMPRGWGAAAIERAVPGVTGAALLVERRAFVKAGGVCEDYVIGDYEDSDLCLRLQSAGGGIVYAPLAELFHFERRSIHLHAGYGRTLASLYNRTLHHDRWDADIEALMAAQLEAMPAEPPRIEAPRPVALPPAGAASGGPRLGAPRQAAPWIATPRLGASA
jgi:GT2 family glycosyltransferase